MRHYLVPFAGFLLSILVQGLFANALAIGPQPEPLEGFNVNVNASGVYPYFPIAPSAALTRNATNENRAIGPQGGPTSTLQFRYEERQIEVLEQIRDNTTRQSFMPGSTGMVNPAVKVPRLFDFDIDNDGWQDLF